MKKIALSSGLLVLTLAARVSPPPGDAERFWPQWRGPFATGVAPENADPPVTWSEEHNIRWKAEIPGKGSATPVIWGNSVFVLTAVPTGEPAGSGEPEESADRRTRGNIRPSRVHRFAILALDRRTGARQWDRTLREELPHESTHPTGTWASPSPVTDGEHVYAFFGSRGLYCLDMEGNLVWEKDLGDMNIRLGFGEGASPFLYRDRLIVNWDHQGQSFIVALNKKTGDEIWRTDREEITSWSTPLVVNDGRRTQVITSATSKVRSYDFENGQLIWEARGMTLNAIPSPVYEDGLLFVTSGFRGNALLAIRLAEARGDITGSDAIAWSFDRDTPYTPSPLLYKGALYFLKSNNGILSSFDARSGEARFGPVRLKGVSSIYASPVGAADRVYIAGRDGSTVVIEHAAELKVLAVNRLEDGFDASPAIVDGEIYLRGKNLYCIAGD